MSSSTTSDTESNIHPKPKHPDGRPADPVWEHFEKNAISTSGHFSAKCNYCTTFMSRGRPHELQVHLAKDCKKCPNDIQLKYLTKIVNAEKNQNVEQSDVKKKRKIDQNQQTILNDYWDDTTEIPKYRQKIIDQAWLKAFVSCGIPFSVIENPFFVDAIKSLRSSYNPPSRSSLSGTLLNHEVIKVNSKVNNSLENMNNLTLGRKILNIYYLIIC
jgi:hypothetical protein